MEFYSFFNLLAHTFLGTAIRGVEGVVTAESTASGAYLTIAVRTAEASVDADFLHTAAELVRHIRGVGVEPPIIAPREHFLYFLQKYDFFGIVIGLIG